MTYLEQLEQAMKPFISQAHDEKLIADIAIADICPSDQTTTCAAYGYDHDCRRCWNREAPDKYTENQLNSFMSEICLNFNVLFNNDINESELIEEWRRGKIALFLSAITPELLNEYCDSKLYLLATDCKATACPAWETCLAKTERVAPLEEERKNKTEPQHDK